MKSFLLAAGISLVAAGPVLAQEPDPVRVCDAFGAGYFIIPGTETCVHAETGEVRQQTEFGTRRRDSALAARVRALESKFCDECFAVIRRDGALTKGAGVAQSGRTGEGKYEVRFERSVTGCSLQATLGAAYRGLPPAPGIVTVSAKDDAFRIVQIQTYALSGTLDDRAFHLTLECVPKEPFDEIN